jgi:hypothetical protein
LLLGREACARRQKEHPVSGSGTFAFTVHPRAHLREDLARAWRPLGLLPDAVYDTALRTLPLPSMTIAGVEIGGHRIGHVILVPFGARHLLADTEGGRVARGADELLEIRCRNEGRCERSFARHGHRQAGQELSART